jgi:hypothetical protein
MLTAVPPDTDLPPTRMHDAPSMRLFHVKHVLSRCWMFHVKHLDDAQREVRSADLPLYHSRVIFYLGDTMTARAGSSPSLTVSTRRSPRSTIWTNLRS